MEKAIIVGGVAGGATAAARLRRLRDDIKITVFERGPYVSFANCGLPYYIGHVIKDKERLELVTPERFLERFNIIIKINHEVLTINRENKTVEIRDLEKGETFSQGYDYLVLSPGASPRIPPFKGLDQVPYFTLRTIPDSVKIKEFVENNNVNHATVIGGGFIGLEVAENLRHVGVKVKIVEMLSQVMPPLDHEMAQFIHQELIMNGVCLQLDDAVVSFKSDGNSSYYVVPKSGNMIKTDLVILSIGIKPENNLAKNLGLELGPKGHIIVDDQMKTSDPSIFAVGDAIQIKNYITGNDTGVALAGPANKQGRIAADVIAGRNSKYSGAVAASVVKVFDMTIASVGLSEKQLVNTDINYEKIYIHPNNHAGYYPGATPITLKLIFEVPSGKVLGAQAVGGQGTEKRIDVISTVIKFNGTVYDLEELELTYAPPYGSAKDPVNIAGYVAANVLKSDMPIWQWHELDDIRKNSDNFLLDVRTANEYNNGAIEGAHHLCDLELRDRIEEVPKDKNIYVYCQSGYRSYLATRFLKQKGYKNVYNLSGGFKLFEIAQMSTEEIADACGGISENIVDEMVKNRSTETDDFIEVNCVGLACPGPLNAMIKALETVPTNKKLRIYATDPGFKSSIEAYSKLNDAVNLLSLSKQEGKIVATIEKGEITAEEIKSIVQVKKKTRKELRGSDAPSISNMDAEELYERLDTEDAPTLLVDVRTPNEYHGPHGHIKGTKLIPLGELMNNPSVIKQYKDEEIVSICHSGSRSMMAAQILAQAGFKDIRNLTGGMINWHRRGYEVENGTPKY